MSAGDKTYNPRKPLEAEVVKKIFTLRSKGMTLIDIGKRFGFSDSHISTILTRKIYSEIDIPENILKACVNPKVKRAARKTKANGIDSLAKAMAAYSTACVDIEAARIRCLAFSMPKEALELIRESLRDGG